jgi:NADH-quinone oxidoreductase subunit G
MVRREPAPLSDQRVLQAIASEMKVTLGLPDTESARAELAELGAWAGLAAPAPAHRPHPVTQPNPGTAILSGWRMLLDQGRMQDGEPNLAGVARPPVARLSPTTAAEIGAADDDLIVVATNRGAVTLPLLITDLPDRVVWLPLNSPGCSLNEQLATQPGGVVQLYRADERMKEHRHE